jgi:amidohydrolase
MSEVIMNLDKDIKQLKENVVAHRRWLHRHPQIGFQEVDARDYIIDFLKTLDFDEVSILAKTGVKAVIKGTQPSKTFAFRADMDALAVTEETGVDFASEYEGFMHACGHDGHMAMLLGFAQWLSENKANLKDNVVLLFQPSEETVGGADPMIQEGALDDPKVDCIFGYHIMPEIPQGKIGLKAGPLMASTSEFVIDIYGVSAHGAMPHRGVDSIVAAAYFITMLQGILTRRIDPFQQALVTIGKLQAGEARNILAPKTHMEGTMRTFDSSVSEKIKKHIQELLKGLEVSHGVRTEFKEMVYYPPVINNSELTAKLEEIIPSDMLFAINPMMIAEDFSYYQQKVPGVFLYLGSKNKQLGYTYPLHSSCFQFDESILLTGIQLYKNILLGLY